MSFWLLITILFFANLPLYFFIGWIVFDDIRNATDNLFATLVEITKAVLIPRVIRIAMGDEQEFGSAANVGIFLAGCILITVAEYYLITRLLFPNSFPFLA